MTTDSQMSAHLVFARVFRVFGLLANGQGPQMMVTELDRLRPLISEIPLPVYINSRSI